MKFKKHNWPSNGQSHIVVEVNFEKKDIDRALRIANSKLDHIDVHSPGGIARPAGIIKSRLIAGKLADFAVEALLNNSISKRDLNLLIEEYDSVREDNFLNPDPFDLRLVSSDKYHEICEIEVRSSFCYKLAPVQKIVDKLSIYGWYTSHNKPTEPMKDLYWQVIYYSVPADISDNASVEGLNVFDEQIENGECSAFIVGGCTQDMLTNKTLSSTRRDQDNAYYQSISPISKGLDCQKLINAMFDFELTYRNNIK